MSRLSNHVNLNPPLYTILLEKGFQVWWNEESEIYSCEKEGFDFCAKTLAGLLGLVTLFEERYQGKPVDYWWRRETDPYAGDLFDKIPREPKPYRSVPAE